MAGRGRTPGRPGSDPPLHPPDPPPGVGGGTNWSPPIRPGWRRAGRSRWRGTRPGAGWGCGRVRLEVEGELPGGEGGAVEEAWGGAAVGREAVDGAGGRELVGGDGGEGDPAAVLELQPGGLLVGDHVDGDLVEQRRRGLVGEAALQGQGGPGGRGGQAEGASLPARWSGRRPGRGGLRPRAARTGGWPRPGPEVAERRSRRTTRVAGSGSRGRRWSGRGRRRRRPAVTPDSRVRAGEGAGSLEGRPGAARP